MIGIQPFSLGVLALQNKRYFEELFHLGSNTLQKNCDLLKSRLKSEVI